MLARLRSHPVVLDRTWDLVLVVAAVEGIPRIAGLLAGTLVPALEWLDPDRAALAVTIHHLWQLALTLLAMLLVDRRRGLAGWGFTLRDARVSQRQAVPCLPNRCRIRRSFHHSSRGHEALIHFGLERMSLLTSATTFSDTLQTDSRLLIPEF